MQRKRRRTRVNIIIKCRSESEGLQDRKKGVKLVETDVTVNNTYAEQIVR